MALSQAPVQRAGAPGGPGCAGEVDRGCKEGMARAPAGLPRHQSLSPAGPLLAWKH